MTHVSHKEQSEQNEFFKQIVFENKKIVESIGRAQEARIYLTKEGWTDVVDGAFEKCLVIGVVRHMTPSFLERNGEFIQENVGINNNWYGVKPCAHTCCDERKIRSMVYQKDTHTDKILQIQILSVFAPPGVVHQPTPLTTKFIQQQEENYRIFLSQRTY